MTNDNLNASKSFVTCKFEFKESSSGFEQEILAYAGEDKTIESAVPFPAPEKLTTGECALFIPRKLL